MLNLQTSMFSGESTKFVDNATNSRSEFQQLNKQLFIQLRTKFIEQGLNNGYFSDSDRKDPDFKLTHNDIINYLRVYMKEFRPLTDMIVSQLSTIVFRIKQIKTTEEEELKGEPSSPKRHVTIEDPKSENEEQLPEGEGNQEEQKVTESDLPIPNEEIEEDDSELKTPEDIKKRFLSRCVCLQLYSSGLQISKNLHQFFDPEKRGYCSLSKAIFTLLNYYKLVMLPSDIRIVLNDYIIDDTKLDETQDLFDYEEEIQYGNKKDSTIKINYLEFLQQVARPYVFEVAKKELFVSYQEFMRIMFSSLTSLQKVCRENLEDIYRTDVKEIDINSFTKF